MLVTDIISLVLVLLGALLVLTSAIGMVRFGDTMSRVHAITKPQTAGLIVTIIGAIVRLVGSPSFGVPEKGDIGILLLLIIFAFITSPVTAQRLGRVSRREGLYGEDMARNDAPAERSLRRRRERK